MVRPNDEAESMYVCKPAKSRESSKQWLKKKKKKGEQEGHGGEISYELGAAGVILSGRWTVCWGDYGWKVRSWGWNPLN